ncbi:MAG: hypothetical protein HFF10_03745 [Angelakisella sp.]|jgi:hypothetical protein|nr:hypothetical protein [Angelakisella sp.]
MKKRDRYNASGYLDMTAYLAIRNIQRDEAKKRRRNQAQEANYSTGNESHQQAVEEDE